MITKNEFNLIQKGFEIYKEQLVGKIFTYTYREKDTKKLKTFDVQFRKSGFLHLCGLKYKKKPKYFYDDLNNKRIRFKDVSHKSDGTTELKLSVLPYLDMIIKPSVRTTGSGTYQHLRFDKSIRTSKDIFAVSCVYEKKRNLVSQSLLNLKHAKGRSNSLKKSHAVEKIEYKDIATGNMVVLFDNTSQD